MKRKPKLFLSLLLSLTFLLALLPGMALAAGNSLSAATPISFGTSYEGAITTSNTKDYYAFTLPSSGRLYLSATAEMEYIQYILYDADGKQLWSDWYQWNSTTQKSDISFDTDLSKGTYYLCVTQRSSSPRTGNYEFSLTATIEYVVPPAITTQPKSVTAAAGNNVTFKVVASGTSLTYQWQYLMPGGSWKDSPAAGNRTATLTVPATADRNGYKYRCIVKMGSLTVTSAAATLTVK